MVLPVALVELFCIPFPLDLSSKYSFHRYIIKLKSYKTKESCRWSKHPKNIKNKLEIVKCYEQLTITMLATLDLPRTFAGGFTCATQVIGGGWWNIPTECRYTHKRMPLYIIKNKTEKAPWTYLLQNCKYRTLLI